MTVSEDLSFFDAADDAKSLSAEHVNTHASSAQYLVFVVSGMEMAVALASVSEIVPYERVSELPGMPPFVRGVVHVRERVIPVVDLAVKLCRRSEPITKRSCILMLELSLDQRTDRADRADEMLAVGIVMDGVATLLDVSLSQIRGAPRFGTQVDARYISGLVPTERGMLPIVDFSLLFAPNELSAVADIVADAASEHT